jgi:hypothetical protein
MDMILYHPFLKLMDFNVLSALKLSKSPFSKEVLSI